MMLDDGDLDIDEYKLATRPFGPTDAHAEGMPHDEVLEPLAIQSAASLKAKPIPPREWIVEEWIPAKTVTIVNGDGATGKSLLLLQLAVTAVAGGYWCGREVKRGSCLFISAEDDDDELHRRLADIVRGSSIDMSDLADLLYRSLAGEDAILAAPEGKRGLLKPSRLFQQLDRIVDQQRPMLVILDTLADMFGGDEINRGQARQFITLLRSLCAKFGATVVLLAHPSLSGMASGSGSSGSTGWSNSSRSRLYLERIKEGNEEADPDLRILSKKKVNYGRPGDQIRLRWRDGMFVPEAGPDSLVVVAAQNGVDRLFLELVEQYRIQGREVSDADGSKSAPKEFAADPRAKGISKRGFAEAMARLFAAGRIRIETYGPPSRRSRRIVVVPTNPDG